MSFGAYFLIFYLACWPFAMAIERPWRFPSPRFLLVMDCFILLPLFGPWILWIRLSEWIMCHYGKDQP